ncbi:hypothetical protein PHLH4_47410 [Pseudomonas sp. St316]|nr:hypothetical protein PHLH4_47410 [Pseudomonas sp. St316]
MGGSELARDGGGSVTWMLGLPASSRASSLPQRFLVVYKISVHRRFLWEPSLLAIAVGLLASMLNVPKPSRASFAPTGSAQTGLIGVHRPQEPGRLSGRLEVDVDLGHTEPRRGAEWWGKAFLVTFGALPKVTRCKSGTLGSRYRSNGYTHHPSAKAEARISQAMQPACDWPPPSPHNRATPPGSNP